MRFYRFSLLLFGIVMLVGFSAALDYSYTFASTDNAIQISGDGSAHPSPWSVSWAGGQNKTVMVTCIYCTDASCVSKYVFANWSGMISSTSASISIITGKDTDGTYTANYRKQHLLSAKSSPEITSIHGDGYYYDQGTTVRLTAPAVAGYTFSKWQVTGINHGSNPTIDIIMNKHISAIAFYNQTIPADTTLPGIAITSPDDDQQFSRQTIKVRGTASDNVAVSRVEVKVGSGNWQTASGTTTWNLSLILEPGVNSIRARATDTSGNSRETSLTATLTPLVDRIGIYKDGSWYLDMNGNGVWDADDKNYGFGAPLWTPVAGDWNNDGKTEIGVYRDGAWYLDYDNSGWWSASDKNYGFGAPGWTPVVGDWNGDGYGKVGAYSDGAWYLDFDGSGTWNAGDKNFAFGEAGWNPVIGKWTPDGKSKVGVYKEGVYYIDYNGDWAYGPGDKIISFGTAGSTAVTGDWNANSLTKVGTLTGNSWKLDYDGLGAVNASTKSYTFGTAGWDPVTGDWNADGNDKIGICLDGAWYLDYNGNGAWDIGDKNFAFGTSGWIPIVGKWI